MEAEIALKGFYDAQWTFCFSTLSKYVPSFVNSQVILPIQALKLLSEDRYSRVSKTVLDEEYENLYSDPRRDSSEIFMENYQLIGI